MGDHLGIPHSVEGDGLMREQERRGGKGDKEAGVVHVPPQLAIIRDTLSRGVP